MILAPIRYLVGALRVLLSLAIALVYFLLVDVVSSAFRPIPPLYRGITGVLTAILARLALFVLSFFWISVTPVSRKRGRSAKDSLEEKWTPQPGDIIVSNWVSWIEILWLAFRFNPIFVLPIAQVPSEEIHGPSSSPVRKTGRKTGTGSANISTPTTSISSSLSRTRVPISGFREVSLLRMIFHTGYVPPFGFDTAKMGSPKSLEDIRKKNKGAGGRPIVIFPECSTSNGRALLRFADVFGGTKAPVKGYSVFVMCVRYDAPTALSPTLTLSIPPRDQSALLPNSVRHLFAISTSLSLTRPISIRLLPPSESPSSPSFIVSDVLNATTTTPINADLDSLKEVCEVLIANLGKTKRTLLTWEEKVSLLELMRK